MKRPLALERMMFGFIESQAVFVADALGLFDYLADNAASCLKISKDLNLPASSLHRLLIVLQCMTLLDKKNDYYSLVSDWEPFLVRTSPAYCGGMFTHYWKKTYRLFDHLLTGVQENQAQYGKMKEIFGSLSSPDEVYQQFIYSDPQATQEFLSTMWSSGYKDSLDLCEQYSFAAYDCLVDLGGATGSFAIAALQKNEFLTAVIMDYPAVKPFALEQFKQYQVQERALFQEGDLMADELPKGDIYVIGYLLSDWPEAKCLSLLQKVYDNLPENGLLLILEKLFDEDYSGPYLTAMLNLTMLLEMHGQHRSYSEYTVWLEQIGFSSVELLRSAGEKHMIVAQKKS